jgi:hypothetical protein
LSRKGFDSKNGGIPSPILPDGTLLSLPIPQVKGRPYVELRYSGETYKDIIEQLGGKCGDGGCHLDPDIRQGIFEAPADWKPVFGQGSTALAHLSKQGVGIGDLFLFFGWFKQTERDSDGKLRYVPKFPDLHILFGYLQVGQTVSGAEVQGYPWHPHSDNEADNNRLFVAREKASWDSGVNGWGVFPYGRDFVLTKDGMKRSCWRLPEITAFKDKPKISGSYTDAWRADPQHGEHYRAMDIGQEFVIEECPAVGEWAKALINSI